MTNDWGNNNDEERMVINFFLTLVSYMIAAAVFALMLCMCSGCSAKRAAVGGSSLRVDTVCKVSMVRDTVRTRDSVWVETYLRGDTVYRVKEVWRWRERAAARADTVYKAALRCDTIRVQVPAERQLSWWERNVTEPLGDIVRVLLWVCSLVVLLVCAVWVWRRVRDSGKRKE